MIYVSILESVADSHPPAQPDIAVGNFEALATRFEELGIPAPRRVSEEVECGEWRTTANAAGAIYRVFAVMTEGEQLEEKYGDAGHPLVSLEDWLARVAGGERRGYWDFVADTLEFAFETPWHER